MFKQIAANRRAGTRQAAGGYRPSVQFSRTDHRKYSFAVRTVEKWNNLPDDINSNPNVEIFRSRMGNSKLNDIQRPGQGSKGEPVIK
jgi:hypothetical protein